MYNSNKYSYHVNHNVSSCEINFYALESIYITSFIISRYLLANIDIDYQK